MQILVGHKSRVPKHLFQVQARQNPRSGYSAANDCNLVVCCAWELHPPSKSARHLDWSLLSAWEFFRTLRKLGTSSSTRAILYWHFSSSNVQAKRYRASAYHISTHYQYLTVVHNLVSLSNVWSQSLVLQLQPSKKVNVLIIKMTQRTVIGCINWKEKAEVLFVDKESERVK